MVPLKTLVSVVTILLLTVLVHVDAAPTKLRKRLLLPLAPKASDIDGAHLLLKNDVDSSKLIKNAFVLLSKPRNYYDGMKACVSMGDAVPGLFGNCLAVNKKTGNTDTIPCSTQLPTICFNSVMRRVLLFEDASRQIKVDTPVGQIQGWRDQNAFRFLGIPYAEPPVQQLRFAAPVPKAPFTGTWDALRYKHICPQTQSNAGFIPLLLSYLENGATENEDCLNLNVYTPSLKGQGASLLPVMVYIHGGGFVSYSGSVIIFEPGNLVSRGGVVVVTINYRLGMLGWMESGAWPRSNVPGNQAFRDQIVALQWVKKNIASFGGDPNRVTVFGESAGATSIRALLSAPTTFDLYQSVIGQSDPLNIPFKPPSEANQIGEYFMQALNCPVTDLDCARSRPIDQVLAAQSIANTKALADDKWTTWALVERPTIDGDLITAEFSQLVKAGKYNTKANIMWGSTKDEAGLFVPQYFPNPVPIANVSSALELVFSPNRSAFLLTSPYFQPDPNDSDAVRDLFTRAGTQYYFFCPLRYLSRQLSKNKNTYNFRFNRGRDTPLVGDGYCSSSTGRVCHSADIQPSFASGAAIPTIPQTGDDARFARQVVDRFTTFAKTGNPNPQPGQAGFESDNPDVSGVQWPGYDDSNPVLELNVQSSVSKQAENDVCSWIDTIFLYDFWLQIPGNAP
ncbi:hypothetical protein BGW38_001656 [Lunasporangiospora selenospora]|uniref:Carboxylic ester hydrolase n=1 Tax=Lunasporangiospora selenospora TaxID=979761 RepID=A0A9P6FTV5_9FUNG|nr:hypothetical protein BGW38_001656 [Lunasporangiospora selenospora]